MSDNADENEERQARQPDDGEADDNPRMRFKGIIESGARAAAGYGAGAVSYVSGGERRWNSMSRQVWQMARLTSVFVFFSMIVGLPLGNWFAHRQLNALTGADRPWNPLAAFEIETLLFAFIIPALVLFIGYAVSRLIEMIRAAESIAAAAQRIVTPDLAAAENADSVGAVVQGHMTALNEGLDGALTRLASVEAMIRQHVEAIEIAGEAIEARATGAVGRVADERSRLMELTETLNAHADSFAAAIAEKAKTTISSLESAEITTVQAEKDFDERLHRLESAAERAFNSFESLRDALRDVDESMRASAQAIDASTEETNAATQRAKAAADAAAESAARNAANIGSAARAASEEAKKAAEEAVETAREHATRTAKSAIDATTEESAKVQDAAAKALEDITKSTSDALTAASDGALKATKAAEDVTDAARRTGEAAEKASTDVAAASDRARKSSEDAMKFSETEAARIEERNQALAEARAALEKENARLESLIDEQRKRADRLAEAIASQTDRLSRLAEAQLREQEAAARLAEAQNEMQARADRQAAEKKKAEAAARQTTDEEEARKTEKEAEATLDLTPAARRKEPPLTAAKTAPEIPPQGKPAPEKAAAQNKPAEASAAPASGEKPAAAPAKKPNGAARLDELARDIAERRPSKQAAAKEPPLTLGRDEKSADGKRNKGNVSWREILDAAEEAAPLDLGKAAKDTDADADARKQAEDAIRIIAQLQDFTHELETRLYGDPPPALQERFERGDRNVFANRLLRLNEADVKRRIRTESGRDRRFESGVHEFLQGFEQLLEDATTSETADEELEEYLSSPLGRVYLLIGATVGYFA
ncbi:hypothetical protein [Hyphococcus luteus]|uniref:Uncharacterized protein n=1 Tax=Hyphococcus luteus TaxID=2058213 RepID=A0A2S7K977_9PROT|nr:hypothetical protein [Marinicaulis flavus]PQA89038.1 hypothetical protein CW354_03560 [Marinicaulis flavus]